MNSEEMPCSTNLWSALDKTSGETEVGSSNHKDNDGLLALDSGLDISNFKIGPIWKFLATIFRALSERIK